MKFYCALTIFALTKIDAKQGVIANLSLKYN